MDKVKLGTSACLLGQEVRFDGGHKRDRFLTDSLSNFVEFVSYCPELAIGMGVPRPAIHLEGDSTNPRIVGVHDKSLDVTERLVKYSAETCKKLPEISGYILKSKSPTCGMERINVYKENGQATKDGIGVFARELIKQYPYLPIEDEGRLNDAVLRENFIMRVFVFHRWKQEMQPGITSEKLIDFHTRHKLLLMSHHLVGYRKLGNLLSNLKGQENEAIALDYITNLMSFLKYKATPAKHVNALQHCMGYFKKSLTSEDKKEMFSLLMQYKKNEVPLVVPLTMVKHYLQKHPNLYLKNQIYFDPYPQELKLRNHTGD